MSDIEVREVEFRLGEEPGTITGIAVPFNQPTDIGGAYREQFAPGAIRNSNDVKIFYGHDHADLPIGRVVDGRDTPNGYQITAKLTSGVQRADETLALMRDGVLNKFSVGFVPVEQTREGDLVTRTLVDLKEVSVVPFPAYSGAEITQVREEQETATSDETPSESESEVSENTELDVRAIQDELVEVRRMVEANVAPQTPVASSFEKFRSQGEFAKALVNGDEAAIELTRAATSANTYSLPGWVGFINNLINLNRPSWAVWSTGALPASGMTVDYAKVSANTVAVGKQTTENTAISDGQITIANTSTAVNTYAGKTTLSRQLVERSSTPYLDTAFQALSIAYANQTNAAAVAAIAALNFTGKTFAANGATAKSILEGITDGAKYIRVNSGLTPQFLLVDPDAYKYLVSIVDTTGRPIVRVDGGAANGESIGFAAPAQLSGSIFGLPIIVDTTLSSKTAYLAHSSALQVFESAGAPVRLVDDMSGVTTLTNNYAVYGYAAITVPFEAAIVKLNVTTA